MNTREKVLKEALNCVNGEREKQYGSPEDNFKRIATLWTDYINMSFKGFFEAHKIGGIILEPIDVAKMMILFKIARSNGDKDKLDNYVDMIGYGACAAEIFERSEEDSKKVKEWVNKVDAAEEYTLCSEKDKPDEKCNRKDCGQFDACMTAYQHYIYNKTKEASEAIDKCMCENSRQSTIDEKANAFDQYGTNVLLDQKDPYSYFHDKLSNYVSIKAKEEHVPLGDFKSVNHKFLRVLVDYLDQASKDCVENGKRFLACYYEIDKLFEKYYMEKNFDKEAIDECMCENKINYSSYLQSYNNISDYIVRESSKANVNPCDVVNNLTCNKHAPTEMASLLLTGRINSETVDSYIEKAINELKKGNEGSICRANEIAGEINSVIETAKHLKGYKYDHIDLNDDQLIIFWRKDKK